MKREKQNERGITLIALVITIIVLLILAGVSIAMLTGENGILNQAKQAKEVTKEAKDNEDMKLLDLYEEIEKYTGSINWEEVLKNAQKHPEQKNSNTIAIGTDGKAVNMDLWEYSLLENGTYCLNSEEMMRNQERNGGNSIDIAKAGYLGSISGAGEIEGKIPQYIKSETDDTFKKVTELYATFYGISGLKISPEIPFTVIDLWGTFNTAGLTKMPEIPYGVVNMRSAFYACKNLKEVTEIPNSVKILRYTFGECSSLETAPTIPESVENMSMTFVKCSNLTGNLMINANISGKPYYNEKFYLTDNVIDYDNCFYGVSTKEGAMLKVEGTCSVLNEVIATKSENSNISR